MFGCMVNVAFLVIIRLVVLSWLCCIAGKPITLRAALARYADLLSPVSKPSLQALSAFAEGDAQTKLRRLLSPDGVAEYKAWHQQSRSLLEVLEEFSSCRPPLGELHILSAPELLSSVCDGEKDGRPQCITHHACQYRARRHVSSSSDCNALPMMIEGSAVLLSFYWCLFICAYEKVNCLQVHSLGPSCSACKSASIPSPHRPSCTPSPSTSPALSCMRRRSQVHCPALFINGLPCACEAFSISSGSPELLQSLRSTMSGGTDNFRMQSDATSKLCNCRAQAWCLSCSRIARIAQ